MKILYYFLSLCIFGSMSADLLAQNITGHWEGIVSTGKKQPQFSYVADLMMDGQAISGRACSSLPKNDLKACFELSGIWEGERALLQEIKQLSPDTPEWCLKYMTLELKSEAEGLVLTGTWKADHCQPGSIRLLLTSGLEFTEQEIPFAIEGKWTGHLSQSDRDYGFFYQVDMKKGGNGTTFIVSEDNGGSATHLLKWRYDSINSQLDLLEPKVIEKTDDKWLWCLKHGLLDIRKETDKFIMEGAWSGPLEEKDAPCAPGRIYLEKPILTKVETNKIDKDVYPYEQQYGRKVNIGRTLSVKNDKVKLFVWDNGTVDGDYVTLFLNGKRILHNFKVSKHKKMIPVTLKKEENILILHAEDLGDIPPNTVAVSVKDGKKLTTLVMNSNLKESGGVLIKRFKLLE